jgi:hypothetical protein
MTMSSRMRALICLVFPALLGAGCAADKSYALVSVRSTSGQFNDVAQLLVTVQNGRFVDDLSYPKTLDSMKLVRFDEVQPLTFSVGYRSSSHQGTLVVEVTPLNAAGATLGYGKGTAEIVAEKVTEVSVPVMRGASPPVRLDAGTDGREAGPGPDAGPPCDPVAPTSCNGGTCFVACRVNQPAVGMCTMAGTKNAGDLSCGTGKPSLKTCLRFCKDDGQCGSGRCSTPIPCNGKDTEFKACSQACNPVGEATQGCAAGLNCFVFAGEIPDCECSGSVHAGGDGVACATSQECKAGFLCVSMGGAKSCRPVCRLDAPTTCATGTCTKLVDPDYKIFGACLP